MAVQWTIGGISNKLSCLLISAASVLVVALSPVGAQAQNEQNGNNDSPPTGRVDCRNAALRAVDQSGGQLLSVRTSGDQCVVTILVPGNGDNARPRKKTVQISR
ncbi:hypothetical protein FB480_11157 [Agrobacterium vitis]|nr:hypothetical protein FB480_11157 [Agrobacterium vitis]